MHRAVDQTLSAPQFHAEVINCGLRDQSIGGLVTLPGRCWRVVYLDNGRAWITQGEDVTEVSAPAILWWPWGRDRRLRASAGSGGATLLMSEQMLANTLGHKPEAADLRLMLDRPVTLNLSAHSETRRDIGRCFDMIQREAAQVHPGAATIVEAQARVMAVLVWRILISLENTRPQASGDARRLQAFRMLLETHFRSRWKVGDYAESLGTSPDALNDLCQRALGKTPRALIQERSCYEAQLLLERSTQPLSRIAEALGFSDTPHFSKYFRSVVGLSPGAYRRQARRPDGAGAAPGNRSFSDWP